MESFSLWWDGLSLILKFYWCIAIPFTVFFLLQLIASFIGGGEAPDHIGDAQGETDHGIPFQFLTLKNLVGFFTIFSWTGIACLQAGLSQGITLLISTVAGLKGTPVLIEPRVATAAQLPVRRGVVMS